MEPYTIDIYRSADLIIDNLVFGGDVSCGVHLDMVLYQPTVRLDGQAVVENGVIIL